MTEHAARWVVVVALAVQVAGCRVAPTPAIGPLPTPCGPDPELNRKTIQALIDGAQPGATVRLPPGRCVVARCEVAPGTSCRGVDQVLHDSAIYVGGKAGLTIVGANNGTSVLALAPRPPMVGGLPAYCRPTHLLTVHRSRGVTLGGFTLDGSDPLLPQDDGQCPKDEHHDGRLNEHMHNVFLHTATSVLLERLKVEHAHGDGINLMGDQAPPAVPGPTDGVVIRGVALYQNRRAGISFQRNVGHVKIAGNTIRDTLDGSEIHMEPTGDAPMVGPYEVVIDGNTIERHTPGLAVTLGGEGALFGRAISFVHNVVRPEGGNVPRGDHGGCLQVHNADQVTITDNTVVGGSNCVTITANTSTHLTIARNTLSGFTNLGAGSAFVPQAVIDVRERPVTQNPDCTKQHTLCNVLFSYSDHIVVDANSISQHLPESGGIFVSNSNDVRITGNTVSVTADRTPRGQLPGVSSAAAEIVLGVEDPNPGINYLNERRAFAGQTIRNNHLARFDDGLRLRAVKSTVTLDAAAIDENRIDASAATNRHGIVVGTPQVQTPFVGSLEVSANLFGCGFLDAKNLPPFALVVPPGQAVTGTVGALVPCGAP